MEYKVSEEVKKELRNVTEDARIKDALQFIVDDDEYIIGLQTDLTLIPAPTFNERQKAERILEIFKAEGLTDCHIDDYGNVAGIRKGTVGDKATLLEAHIDTVFPLDTKLEIKRENGFIYCPGITDNTRGDACIISVLRAMNHAGIKTKDDIHFVGTVQEEGIGALRGIKYYLEHHPEINHSISVDGSGYQGIVFEATGIHTYEFIFKGIGGHACGHYGKLANPLGAAARATQKITDLVLPEFPMTTAMVTGTYAGSYESIHAIVDKAVITVNFRSNGHKELMETRDRIIKAVEEACREETERWGMNEITYEMNVLIDIDAGTQDRHAPIVEAAYEISRFLGCEEPELEEGGSTNCNRAIEKGIPAVCLGAGAEFDSRCHSLAEQFMEKDAYKGCQQAMLLSVMCAGLE